MCYIYLLYVQILLYKVILKSLNSFWFWCIWIRASGPIASVSVSRTEIANNAIIIYANSIVGTYFITQQTIWIELVIIITDITNIDSEKCWNDSGKKLRT